MTYPLPFWSKGVGKHNRCLEIDELNPRLLKIEIEKNLRFSEGLHPSL